MSLLQSLVPTFGRSPANTNGSQESDQTPSIRPTYEVKETPDAYGLTVYLPGVAKDGLELTVDSEFITIKGRRNWKAPSEWAALYRESTSLPFLLHLSHDQAIDSDKIAAELKE